jgi:DNA repair protein RadA/Sms
MSRIPSVFECQSCGYSSAKWLGRCPDCGNWNSFVEEKRMAAPKRDAVLGRDRTVPIRLSEVSTEDAPRVTTANEEFNRVLGGGIVPGSLVLLGGEPGVGKSTLLLQIAQSLQQQGRRVLYVSGEESAQQIKMRADRLAGSGPRPGVMENNPAPADEMYLVAEPVLESIFAAARELRPTDIVIDSVQTTFSESLDSAPGSISQVRHVATELLKLAKSRHISVFLIGHVTKDGSIAGPKALEHIVDTVLYFEGERHHNHRIVRAVKNRFGAANEVGIFEMTTRGLLPVQNASALFLREREAASTGSAVVCALEGTRPILVELQALVGSTQYSTGRRVSTGVDYNRISVLVAMLEKRLGFHLTGCDIYVNAAGGLEISEPAADLGIVAAILSSFRNHPVSSHTVLMGELGLSGEVRPVSQIYPRIREAAAMGFRKCVVPAGNLPLFESVASVELVPLRSVSELSDVVFVD